MKKPYSAPRLYAERFTLYEHISACGAPSETPLLSDRSSCGYVLDESGAAVFNSGVPTCIFQIEEGLGDDLINQMCYNTNAVEIIGAAYGS